MQDIVSQMVVKWARFGGDTPIDASEDFTKLTLDSIALYVYCLSPYGHKICPDN